MKLWILFIHNSFFFKIETSKPKVDLWVGALEVHTLALLSASVDLLIINNGLLSLLKYLYKNTMIDGNTFMICEDTHHLCNGTIFKNLSIKGM